MKLFAIIFAAIIAAFACIALFVSVTESRAAYERRMIAHADTMAGYASDHFNSVRSITDIPDRMAAIVQIRSGLVDVNKLQTKPRIVEANQRAIEACDRYIAELKQLQVTYRR